MDPEEEEGVSTPTEDVLEVETEEVEAEEEETEQPEEAEPVETDPEPTEEAEDDEVVVTIGDEPEPEPEKAPEWVRDLRKREREQRKRIRELEAMFDGRKQPVEIGPKPTLESVAYDEDRFAESLTAWHEQKRQADARKQAEATQAEAEATQAKAEQAAWQSRLSEYDDRKKSFKVNDFEEAEAAVSDKLSVTQQGIILQGAKAPEELIYAIGKRPELLAELSGITDAVKFTFAIADLQGKISVKPRKPKTAPEKRIAPSAGSGASTDSKLEKLRAKAAETGDMSAVLAYKKQQREAGR